ncbi:MAG: squalene/phytoene synthase family protein, partial [Planctomycetaceae bacterium]|nr:squalene/phytoene synthase family protein [Planctomycetaceae bacterium]
IREYEIPREPFRQLLVAFRQDQHVTRYETEGDLFDYCRSSANPVGRLVLYLGRCCDAENAALADHICTALQIANFCQDVRRDWERGRIYLPRETRERCGCREQQLAAGVFDDAWRAVVAYHAAGAEVLFAAGEPLVARLPRELQLDVWLFIAGGRAILRKIREAGYDVWSRRPVVGKRAQLGLLARGGWLKLCGRLGQVRGAAPGAGA